jgi:hypothetical protein
LLAFEPDENKPTKIRIQLSNNAKSQDATALIQKIDYDEQANPVKEKAKIIEKLNLDQQNEVKQKILNRAKNYVDPLFLTVGVDEWRFSFERNEAFTLTRPLGNIHLGLMNRVEMF